MLFECNSIVLFGRSGGGGFRNPVFSRTSFVNGPLANCVILRLSAYWNWVLIGGGYLCYCFDFSIVSRRRLIEAAGCLLYE